MNIVFYLLEATSTVEAPFKIMVSYSTTADRLAQLVERGSSRVRAPNRTNTQGLKITEENMLPLQWHLLMVRYSSLLG